MQDMPYVIRYQSKLGQIAGTFRSINQTPAKIIDAYYLYKRAEKPVDNLGRVNDVGSLKLSIEAITPHDLKKALLA